MLHSSPFRCALVLSPAKDVKRATLRAAGDAVIQEQLKHGEQ